MSSPHERLDRAIDERRLELGMRWADLASAAKVSEVTLRAVRRGKPATPLSIHGIEDALRWEHGSIQALLDGGEATVTTAGAARHDADDWPEDDDDLSDDELRAEMARLREDSRRLTKRVERVLGLLDQREHG